MKLDRRLLRQAVPMRGALALTVILGLVTGIVIIIQARILSLVVSQVFLDGASLDQVGGLLAWFLGLGLLRAVCTWAGEVTANSVAGKVKQDLRGRLAAHLLMLGPAYASGERTGELVNTAIEGIENLDAYFCRYLPQLALAALLPLAILAFVFPLDWVSGLVMLLTAPLIPLFMVLIGNVAEALTRRQWTSLSRMSAYLLDALQGLATLKLLNRSREQIRIIGQIGQRYRQTTMEVLRVTFLSALVLEMVATISTAVVAVQIGLRLLYGQLSFDEGFFVLLLAPEFYLPLRTLGARFHAGMEGVAAARRIFEVLETPQEPGQPGGSKAAEGEAPPWLRAGAGLAAAQMNIRCEDVHYAYEGDERPAIRGLSLELAAGETVALVGPSGAGKSTLAYLLLRFIEPQRGSITIAGQPLGSMTAAAWRRQVAWVPQNPYLFHGTVADNIRLSRPEVTMAQIEEAAQLAHIHAFVAALPEGYGTIVGERGTRLSGGEAQRVALARAFLKDAPLLILDEATANLDPENEALLTEAMDQLLKGRTALVIAHRLGTIYRANRILVMEEGRIVEKGTHASLIQEGGLYRRLVGAYGGGGAR